MVPTSQICISKEGDNFRPFHHSNKHLRWLYTEKSSAVMKVEVYVTVSICFLVSDKGTHHSGSPWWGTKIWQQYWFPVIVVDRVSVAEIKHGPKST